jgi:integrase
MKGRKEHRVPLSQAAFDLLGERRADGASLFKVSSARGMLSTLKDHGGNGFTVHGFRATFSGWGVGAGYDADTIDRCIAHETRGKVRKAYQRDDLLPQRRKIMTAWSAFCAGA